MAERRPYRLSLQSDQRFVFEARPVGGRTASEILRAWVEAGLWAKLGATGRAFAGVMLALGEESNGGWLTVKLPPPEELQTLMGAGIRGPWTGRNELELAGVMRPHPGLAGAEKNRWWQIFASPSDIPAADAQAELPFVYQDADEPAHGTTRRDADEPAHGTSVIDCGVLDAPRSLRAGAEVPGDRASLLRAGAESPTRGSAPARRSTDGAGDFLRAGAEDPVERSARLRAGAGNSAERSARLRAGAENSPNGTQILRAGAAPCAHARKLASLALSEAQLASLPRDEELEALIEEAGIFGRLADEVRAEPCMTAQILRTQLAKAEAKGCHSPWIGAKNAINIARKLQTKRLRQERRSRLIAQEQQARAEREQAERADAERQWQRVHDAIARLPPDRRAQLEQLARQRDPLLANAQPDGRRMKIAVYRLLSETAP